MTRSMGTFVQEKIPNKLGRLAVGAAFFFMTQVSFAADTQWTVSDSRVASGSIAFNVRSVTGTGAPGSSGQIFSVKPVLPTGTYVGFTITSHDVGQTFLLYNKNSPQMISVAYLPDLGLINHPDASTNITFTSQPLIFCVDFTGRVVSASGLKKTYLASQAPDKATSVSCPGGIGLPLSTYGFFSATGRKS